MSFIDTISQKLGFTETEEEDAAEMDEELEEEEAEETETSGGIFSRIPFRRRNKGSFFSNRNEEEEEERNSPCKGILLDDAFGKFERDPERRCRARQLENHRSNWTKFLAWIKANYPQAVFCRQVTPGMAREWAAFFKKKARCINTFNKYLSTAHFVFDCMCQYDDGLRNPFANIHKQPETDAHGKEPFTVEELKAIFAFHDEEFKRLCAIGLYSTLRLGSARLLRWEQYDGDVLHATHDKTGADATLRVPPELKYWLDRVPPAAREGYICPTYAVKQHANASQLIQANLQKLGIQTQRLIKCPNGQIRTACIKGFHSFRHTAITLALDNGANPAQVKRLAGHTTEMMQARYTHLDKDSAGQAASMIGRFWPEDENN